MISISTRLRPFKTWRSVPLLRPWTPTTTSTSRPSPTQPSSTHRFQLSIRRMSVWFAYLFIHLSILSLSFIPTLFNISFSALEYRHGLPIYLYIYIFINYVFPLTSPLMLISLLLDKPYVTVTVWHGKPFTVTYTSNAVVKLLSSIVNPRLNTLFCQLSLSSTVNPSLLLDTPYVPVTVYLCEACAGSDCKQKEMKCAYHEGFLFSE